jgi:hypothetical protein
MPLLKLLFNPNPLIQALHIQSRLNTMNAEREARRESARRAMDQLYYELVHNLVVETTRTGIEVKNLKMRIESISSRLEFNERRARALESAVVYKAQESDEAPAQRTAAPAAPSRQQTSSQAAQPRYTPPTAAAAPVVAQVSPAAPSNTPAQGQAPQGQQQGSGVPGEGPGQRSRRRRRRRGRRGGASASTLMGVPGSPAPEGTDAAATLGATDPAALEDDLEPESEEMDEAAAEPQVNAVSEPPRAEPPVEQAAVSHPALPAAEVASPASTESAPAPAATPDHADHDPQ